MSMLIKRNTEEFNSVQDLVKKYAKDPIRKRKIKIFGLQPGMKLKDRKDVAGAKIGTDMIYDLNYQAVLYNFSDRDFTLHRSDEEPKIYFFRKSNDPASAYAPFQIATGPTKKPKKKKTR